MRGVIEDHKSNKTANTKENEANENNGPQKIKDWRTRDSLKRWVLGLEHMSVVLALWTDVNEHSY